MRDLALEDFPIRTHDKLRYSDTDRQGHVNNAVFATFLETGRTALLYDPEEPIVEPGTAFVLARLLLDYRAEVHWPGDVWIGSRVLEVGRSSMRMEQVIFQNGKRVANGETVIVMVDTTTRRSRPLSDAAAARLRSFMTPEG
ncbi:acyl-CoA thioesterase [Aquabacter cavernae]|uniref:acyl-CoA thioesterase n=1 Tax=Aquabacter cavernae TaxID=2496029 RepID=UPI000F8E3DD6|nr:thioesterase family protein [Aquabacter cavernae]